MARDLSSAERFRGRESGSSVQSGYARRSSRACHSTDSSDETREDIERGMVLAEPGTITPHTSFESEVYVLTKEEGGRHTPFFTGYRPQFYVRTTDVTGSITQFTADDGSVVEMVMPGDRIKMTAELIYPVAIEEGMRFAIREGGRTIGAGVVSKIVN